MDEIITFDKDFQTRLEEYMVVFGDNDKVSASQIKKQWSVYLEFAIDSCGWQALWKIPRLLCDKLEIPFPTVVIVYVDSVDFENLKAEIEVIAVQGDITIPLIHTTSLTRLWPTKQQDHQIDITSIANVLDMYRFFYYQLWMPWDLQENDDSDWVRNHLVDRLQLFFNVKDGNIPNNKTRKFRSLLTEIKTVLERLGDDGTGNINISNSLQDTKNDTYVDLHLKIADLKTEIEILGTFQIQNKARITQEKNHWLVFNPGCTLDKYTAFLESVRNLTDNGIKYKSAVCLQDALNSALSNDTIIISPGKYKINSPGVLDDGVILKSQFQDRNKVTINSLHENTFVDFTGKYLNLENLYLNVSVSQYGFIAQTGSMLIKNCTITGQGISFNQHGIVALPEADIKLENCHISGFGIGFYISPLASVTLTNCIISNVRMPIKLSTNAIIDFNNCTFENYKNYCIYLDTKSNLEEGTTVGDFSLLESKVNLKIANCKFMDSTPVIINNRDV